MRQVRLFLLTLFTIFFINGKVFASISHDIELNDLLLMELEDGVVVIQMFPDKAPWHVYRIKLLVREGFNPSERQRKQNKRRRNDPVRAHLTWRENFQAPFNQNKRTAPN